MSKYVAFDAETHLIQPGILAPPLVCASFACVGDDGKIKGTLLDREQARQVFKEILESNLVISGANMPYDMLVMAVDARLTGEEDLLPAIFTKYQRGEVHDVLVAEKLHAIARGHLGKDPRTMQATAYSLDTVTDMTLYRLDAKENARWRLSYAILENVPQKHWPEDARQYPIDDAVNTLEIALAQRGLAPRMAPHDWTGPAQSCSRCGCALTGAPRGCPLVQAASNLHDHAAQAYAAWCLHLGGAWGMRTDPVAIAELKRAASVGRDTAFAESVRLGFLRPDGTEDQAKVRTAVALAYGATDKCDQCTGGRIPGETTCKTCMGTRAEGMAPCTVCASTGKIPSKTTKACPTCNGTNLKFTKETPLSPTGRVQIGRDTLTESGDDALMAYAASQEDDKILDSYIPFIEQGVDVPITLSYNSPLETGRVSIKGLAQTLPRAVSAHLSAELKKQGASVVGVRDCFVPRGSWSAPNNSIISRAEWLRDREWRDHDRAGCVYFSNDYTGGELVTFAEACVERVGSSTMGQALNAGIDVHSALGATMMGVSYDMFMEAMAGKHGPQAKKRAGLFRQAAKPENFGNPGGMGPVRKVLQQRAQGPDTPHPSGPSMVDDGNGGFVPGYKGLRFCILTSGTERCGEVKITEWKGRAYPPVCRACVEAADRGRSAWFRQWPEASEYLAWHSRNVEQNGFITQLYTGRIRGDTDYSSESNGDFQALLADIAKRALCRVVYEQHVDGGSVLYGSKTILFAHDELFGEAREDVAAEVSARVNVIMIEEFQKGCPNHVPACKAEPTLMRRMRKDAKPAYRDGRLIPWEDRLQP